jgi:tetratricopeptide (TPR) repeat protein
LEAKNRHEIARLLPEVLDSLVASMELGAGFDHAAWKLSKTSDNALAREFTRYLQDVRQGRLRREALLDVAKRVDVPEVTTFCQVVIQADLLGVILVDVLRTLAVRMAALDEVEADLANLRAAWHWAAERRNYQAIEQAIDTLYWFYHSRRRYEEGEALFGLARELLAPQPGERPHPVWSKIVSRHPDPTEDRRAQIERCLEIAREGGDEAETAFCLYALGNAIAAAGAPDERDLEAAVAHYEQSLAHYGQLGDKFYIAEVLGRIAHCHQLMGQPERAAELARRSLDLSREIGDQPAGGSFPFIPPDEEGDT